MSKKSKVFMKTFKDPILIDKLEVCDDTLKIPGFGELTDYHKQSYSCEQVYTDWAYLVPFIDQQSWPIEVNKFEIVGVKDTGFLLKFVTNHICEFDNLKLEVKFFVPCYNCQNGYYSSSLELQISSNGETIKRSISNYVKDVID